MTKLNRFTVVTSESGARDCWGFLVLFCFQYRTAYVFNVSPSFRGLFVQLLKLVYLF